MSARRHTTDRKQAKKKLRHGKDFYRQLVEGSPDAMWVHCRNIIVYVNPACVAFFGASSADDLLGKHPVDFAHPDERKIVTQRIRKMYSEHKPVQQNETRWIRLDGKEIYAEVIETPVVFQGEAGAQVIFRDVSERRRIEQNLRSSEANLAATQRIAHLGSWEQDVTNLDELDKSPPRWSDELFHIFGYEPGQIEPSRRIFLQSLHPDDRERNLNTLMSALHENKSFSADYQIKLPNGSERIIHSLGEFVYDENTHKALKLVEIVQDNTAQKKAEEKFRSLLEAAPDAMVVMNQEGKIVLVNTQTEKLFGYKREEILDETIEFLMPKRFRGEHRGNRTGFFSHPQVRPMGTDRELFALRKDGSEFQVEISLAPVETEEGVLICGAIRDISERKRREEELRISEERFRHLVEGVKDYAITMLDETGHIVSWNAGAERIKGYYAEEIIGKHFSIFFTREDIDAGKPAKELEVAAAKERFEEEGWRVRKDGSRFMANVVTTALRDGSGKLRGFAKISRDISERTDLEQKLSQAQKMEAIGQLAGGIAHDFNNVLNVIFGFSELLLEDIGSNESQRGRIEEIRKAGERTASLVQQLLAFSRKQVLEPKVINLNDVLRNVETMLRRVIGENIELQERANPSAGAVKVDPTQMEQIILNLAVNARDAMPRGGKLTLETANATLDEEYFRTYGTPGTPGEYVMLAISDTGIGMDEATQKRIFEPFFTTKELGKGTGLGLATVYGIVKQSGGYVWMYSEPDRGTTFKVYFPRVYEMPQAPAAAAPSQEETRGTETILVVEDDEALCTVLSEYLLGKGYTVLKAYTGSEAIQIAKRHPGPIDLVITDVIMPEIGGPELADQLAASRPQIKVLFVSGYTQNAIVHQGVLKPGITFLQKPYGLPDVARTIRRLLK